MNKVLITDSVHSSIIKAISDYGCEVTYKPKMSYEELPDIIGAFKGIIINSKIIMNKAMMDKAKNLTFIGRLGSGLDNIDLEYARTRNIEVISAPEGNANAVAEHAMGMLLGLINNIFRAGKEVKSFKWNREKNRGFELENKKIGIIGFGHTGSAFAEKLQCFNVKIYAFDKYKTHFGEEYRYVKRCELKEIQEKCDIISIHLPLTPETKYFVNKDFFSSCKKQPIIINTSRGKILKIQDLINALEQKQLKGACLDVLENERPSSYTIEEKKLYGKLFSMDDVVLTPHIAGWTKESKKKIAKMLITKILSHILINSKGDN